MNNLISEIVQIISIFIIGVYEYEKKFDRFWVFILMLLVVSFYMANAELDENKSS